MRLNHEINQEKNLPGRGSQCMGLEVGACSGEFEEQQEHPEDSSGVFQNKGPIGRGVGAVA